MAPPGPYRPPGYDDRYPQQRGYSPERDREREMFERARREQRYPSQDRERYAREREMDPRYREQRYSLILREGTFQDFF